jgi:Ca-activated chloride channel family protein
VSEREKIELAIEPLKPDGSTNSNAGLELGYGMAVGGFDQEATNRVVFLSDGVANVGETDPAKIAERVKPMRQKGIYLNTIGVGMNNHNDVLLEQLADKADGMCAYIDTADEAKKQLVDNFSGAFQPIARDVKIQVEFDATQVLRYRLLGYENRAIADADFRNDKVDAGELGAGHQVTALYEIERQGTANLEKPLATVRVRWKEPSRFGMNPEADTASEVTQPVSAGPASTFEGAGQSYRKAVMAAQFAEILRRSVHARGDSLDGLLNDALKLQQEIPNDKDFTEFVMLVSKSKDLIVRTMPACDELCQAIDEVRENQYRRAQIESLQRELDQNTLAELRRQNDVLEARLRDLVRRRLENQVR